ncbi:MAG: hypothetical protein ACP5N1_02940 [Candidatus Woesearchaeota archaeon]
MSKEKLEQKINETEYRIITNRTLFADHYLQFKSTKKKINFPDFWNTSKVEVWRYVPSEELNIFYYLNERMCPTSIFFMGESYMIGCFYGQEDFDIGGVTPFTKKYPDINMYFKHFNSLRDEHLKNEKLASKAGTTYLSK